MPAYLRARHTYILTALSPLNLTATLIHQTLQRRSIEIPHMLTFQGISRHPYRDPNTTPAVLLAYMWPARGDHDVGPSADLGDRQYIKH